MKTLNILIVIAWSLFACMYAFSARACLNPISEANVMLIAEKGIEYSEVSCHEKFCYCADGFNIRFLELVDNEVVDYVGWRQVESCKDEADCDEKFSYLSCKEGEEIKNYDQLSVYCAVNIMKIDGKKLAESPSKKEAYEAAELAVIKASEVKEINKQSALDRVKAFEPKATTILGLKGELKAFADDVKKALD